MADLTTAEPDAPEPSAADRAVWRALRKITQGDSPTADPRTPAGQAELGALYVAKSHAAWEELRQAHRARPDTPDTPEHIMPLDAFAEIAGDFSDLTNIALDWSTQILAAAAERTGTALTQSSTLQPPLTWSLTYLLARQGQSVAEVIVRNVLADLTADLTDETAAS